MTAPVFPENLAPTEDERAILSLLAFRRGQDWQVVSGSLLTMEETAAQRSWPRWRAMQPSPRNASVGPDGLDLGPSFVTDPFPEVRIVRRVLAKSQWRAATDGLLGGCLHVGLSRLKVRTGEWGLSVLTGTDGQSDARRVVAAAHRPVLGVTASLEALPLPETKAIWEWQLPPHLKPGPQMGRMYPHRRLVHWPQELLGIDWLAGSQFEPPPAFVVGRLQQDVWVADLLPDDDNVAITLAWDSHRADPLACSLLVHTEEGGLPTFTRLIPVSDLNSGPSEVEEGEAPTEPRVLDWNRRLMRVRVARGPAHTAWGVSLLHADGHLLDARTVAPRIEKITIAVNQPLPKEEPITTGQREAAGQQARDAEAASRQAAADRRFSTDGQLAEYLRWRFCCRAGELLIIDPYLLQASTLNRVIRFLDQLDRPIRALVGSIGTDARKLLYERPTIAARRLPSASKRMHDRVWLIGETGLLVGGSANTFLPDRDAPTRPTTAAPLPYGDTLAWRERFEAWWATRA